MDISRQFRDICHFEDLAPENSFVPIATKEPYGKGDDFALKIKSKTGTNGNCPDNAVYITGSCTGQTVCFEPKQIVYRCSVSIQMVGQPTTRTSALKE